MKIFQWLVVAFLWSLPLNLQGLSYTVQDLGVLAAEISHATKINNQNTIVGWISNADKYDNFIWKQNEGLVLLPHQPHKSPLYPAYRYPFLNNLDQVTDIFWHITRTNYWFANNTETKSKHIYIYDNGNLQDVGSPEQKGVQKLENSQTVSGWSSENLNILSFNDNQQILVSTKELGEDTRFAIWQDGIFKEIDSGAISIAYEMNNHGVILARKWMQKENSNIPMLILYDPIEGTTIEIIEDVNIIGQKLNDRGQVIFTQIVGARDIVATTGFLWDLENGLTKLENFVAVAFNNYNQIVGVKILDFQNKKVEHLMWSPSEVISLDQVVKLDSAEESKLCGIDGINDNGYIIGKKSSKDHKIHAFVLIPQ